MYIFDIIINFQSSFLYSHVNFQKNFPPKFVPTHKYFFK